MSLLQRLVFGLALSWAALPAIAQTGLHVVPFSYDAFTKRGSNCMAVGVDRDVNDHSSIALDVQFGFRLFDQESMQYQQASYQGQDIGYSARSKWIGAQYRSSYLFNDADDASPYISVLVGVRSATMVVSDVNVYSANYGDPVPSWAKESTEQILVFPVGLRFGYRSPLDGYAGDIYFGIAQQLGHDPWAAPFIPAKDQLAGFTFNVGYSYGVGW